MAAPESARPSPIGSVHPGPAHPFGVAHRAFFGVYGLLWRAAAPLLGRNKRLREGLDQRLLREPLPPADLWVQAASVGEAFLAEELLRRLPTAVSGPLSVLVTTYTSQGFDILEKAAASAAREAGSEVTVHVRYFPFDRPALMRAALAQVRPRAAVLLETEIWPGFLLACRESFVPVLLVNGRMRPRSLSGYLTWPSLFRALAPVLVLTVSKADGARYGLIFGDERVEVMPNIKFDRLRSPAPGDNPLAPLLPENARFLVLGSVRKEEEETVLSMLAAVRAEHPDVITGLFPRHMHRLDAWKGLLDGANIPWELRSRTKGPAAPGSVLLWDAFGEMLPAYGLARAAFVGGSLAPLGGQNFLEPLACGTPTVIGPSWDNFAWVGEEIVDTGLLTRCEDEQTAAATLANMLRKTPDRKKLAAAMARYVGERTGGAEMACARIAERLNND